MIPVIFSTDHNFIMPTGVAICSMLLSAGDEYYDIYILQADNVTDDDREKLRLQVSSLSPDSRISFIGMTDKFAGSYETRGISTATYYRLMIPWLLPNLDKAVYLDGDIIVKTPLTELYDTDVEGKYAAGGAPATSDGWKSMQRYFSKIGADYREYVNAGILLINCEQQRKDKLDLQFEKMSQKKFHYQDQDIINVVCRNNIVHFSSRFNLKPKLYAADETQDEKVIIHYAGDKPWKCFTYAWNEWWDVYRRSLFWDPQFYYEVSASILNPGKQLKNLRRKGFDKMNQILANYKAPFKKND